MGEAKSLVIGASTERGQPHFCYISPVIIPKTYPMDILKLAHRLIGADHHIKAEATGTPVEFARKLDISESHLYELLDILKRMGGPIAYSRSRKTYHYTRPVAFRLGYEEVEEPQ
jgi:hypothetical protein